MSRTYVLPDRLEQFIDDQIAIGRYANATEVVQAGLQALEETHKRKAASVEEIRTVIQAGRSSQKTVPASDVFARIESRIREKLGGT